MLRKIRIIAASICFVLITLLFLDFTGISHKWFGWLAEVQLLEAILAVNVGVVLALILVTLIFGRVYCSVICPLGVFQDGISNVAGRKKKKRFKYTPAKSWLRYLVLLGFVVALLAGIRVIFLMLAPYAAYGRIASEFFAPLYRLGNNLLAWFAERINSYAFYSVDVWVKNWTVFGVAALTAGVVGILAWRNGRTYCNTICPVGTLLGFFSRFSIFRPAFNAEKCTKCGLCERNCKASCIDSKNMSVDYSRCVTCMNCIDACKFDAMKYAPRKLGSKKTAPKTEQTVSQVSAPVETGGGLSRRSFLSITALFAYSNTVKAQQWRADGGLAVIEDKKIPNRQTAIAPPGAGSIHHLKQHCTACQLCISACPNGVLRPSGKLSTLMQPEMSYERGYCRPECTRCSEVCPAGAIKPITAAEKTAIKIGHAVWIKENCVVNTDDVTCTNCQRHCPTEAIRLIPRDPADPESLKIPVVDTERCIGCGACEHLCPARPFSAIYVEGNVRHHTV